MAQLILIEGQPGSGKSSLAGYLHSVLSRKERKTKMILETDELNPFRYSQGTGPDTQVQSFLEAIPDQWQKFADEYSNADCIFIQEGMTFQQQVNFLLWENRSEEIKPLIAAIKNQLARFEAHLIYLSVGDPIEAFRKTLQIRGEDWVNTKVAPISESPYAISKQLKFPEALDKFVTEIKAVCDELFGEFQFSKTQIEVDDRNWERVQREALSSVEKSLNT